MLNRKRVLNRAIWYDFDEPLLLNVLMFGLVGI